MSAYTLRLNRADGSGVQSEALMAEDNDEAQLLGEIRFLMSPEFNSMALLQDEVTIFTLSRGAV